MCQTLRLVIYMPSLFTPYQNPEREASSPHFADMETKAQRGAKCFGRVLSLNPHSRK